MHRILLIDDDKQLAKLLKAYFARFDLSLHSITHPGDSLSWLGNDDYDLIVLDIMLPETDGFEVCKRVRKQSNIPIIMLSARGEVMDRIVGIELGADDYLAKPFEPRELVVRIHSVIKRYSLQSAQLEERRFGALTLNTSLRKVTVADNEILLSAMEYKLLLIFIQSPGKIFSRDEILNCLRGVESDLYSRSVDILVSRLRHKLKPVDAIKTVRGQGYVFAGQLS